MPIDTAKVERKLLNERLIQALDAFVPQAIKEAKKAEQLNRARTLVFLILIHLVFTSLALIGSLFFSYFIFKLDIKMPLLVSVAVCGHALALSVFRYTARQSLSGNIFAATYFYGILFCLIVGAKLDPYGILLFLPTISLLVTFVASYISGLFWLCLTIITPIGLNLAGYADYGTLFIANWAASCLGLFIIIYVTSNFINRLSERLYEQFKLLEFAAGHDPLTKLANRAAFEKRFAKSIAESRKTGSKSVLAYIDLDKFKLINDVHGHHAGDAVLIAVADRLQRMVRDVDTVARLGGDEFAVLFEGCSLEMARPLLNRIHSTIKESIIVSGNRLTVDCSLGVAVFPDEGTELDQLARKADARMYEAKHGTAN